MTRITSDRNNRENFPSFTGGGRTPPAIRRQTLFLLIPPSISPARSRLIKTSPSFLVADAIISWHPHGFPAPLLLIFANFCSSRAMAFFHIMGRLTGELCLFFIG